MKEIKKINRNAMYCLIFRIRKTVPDIIVDTKARTFHIADGGVIPYDRKIRRLINEFHFHKQLTIFN
jgi:hypothetical protein